MSNYSKTKLKIHPKEGLQMETYASPFIKTAIGIAIIFVAVGLTLLFSTPFISAIRWW